MLAGMWEQLRLITYCLLLVMPYWGAVTTSVMVYKR